MAERVAVLFGGPSKESEVSKRSAIRVCDALLRKGYDAKKIEYDGKLIENLKGFDKVFNVMHGRPGEDGIVQGILEYLKIPYTGSGVIPSSLTINKYLTQQMVKSLNIPVLNSHYINRKIFEKDENIVEKNFKGKVILKPNTGGSSVGTFISDSSKAKDLLKNCLNEFNDYLIEEYLENGLEVTVGVIEYKGKTKVLTPLQLKPKNRFYDYEAKYTKGKTDFIIPPEVDRKTVELLMERTLIIFESLNMKSFARVDYIIDRNERIFELEVNSIPGMTDLSDLPMEAEYDGIKYDDLVEEILKSAGILKDA
ncbi:MAG: D-alanine--D-alanine ligase [bacterium]|uniref:D-alanine--D-alanine ligase n=2 Tax=Bacteria candidate phyla TaxID=1783234 RepID=A0A101I374_UNCT6|nr:MAG: D-alanine--D-alanine ligase [candidate division TA06 bacterium 32_111]KUK87830.1 MAG: D-alanine--D-alanine ligase [candidate division TA06 bacterium 34_109]MDI6700639.1 D-alanine--D-alanine ligase [bacterium]HAF07983.1 D-alanine--D-alanine ligase [candidate division WOR-3 bacterium]HCP16315.1 D-alanine--D-alanine ligase [candidate division WOR-3 bacterium]